jgi:hypothetical protein
MRSESYASEREHECNLRWQHVTAGRSSRGFFRKTKVQLSTERKLKDMTTVAPDAGLCTSKMKTESGFIGYPSIWCPSLVPLLP